MSAGEWPVNTKEAADVESPDRAAGIALIVAGAGAVLGMSHHPTALAPGDTSRIVHAAMILFLAMTGFGLIRFATRLGMLRTTVLAGFIAYAIAFFANIGAATISGFIVPALAQRGFITQSPDVLRLTWEANQALAWLGVLATGAAFAFWSLQLLGRKDWDGRAAGALGLLAGFLPIALLAAGWLEMKVAGAYIVYGIHAAWTAVIGLQLYRGKLWTNAPQ